MSQWSNQVVYNVVPPFVLDTKSPDLMDLKVSEPKSQFLIQFFLKSVNFLTSIYVSGHSRSIPVICAFTPSKSRPISTILCYSHHPNCHSSSLNTDFNAILLTIDSQSSKLI